MYELLLTLKIQQITDSKQQILKVNFPQYTLIKTRTYRKLSPNYSISGSYTTLSMTVGIVGAGLVGCLAALALAQKGYDVVLYDLRDDPRILFLDKSLRSINLAVSDRGIRALKYVDLQMADRILQNIIPMKGRMIHDSKGNQESQLYGLFGESINSIDRRYLNTQLLDEIDKFDSSTNTGGGSISLKFNHKLIDLDFQDGLAVPTFSTPRGNTSSSFQFVVGSDGSHSSVRSKMQKHLRMNYKQEWVDMCYIELSIPAGKNGEFPISPNHLHIWPRHSFMLIALANPDGSFTSTFFAPWDIAAALNDKAKVIHFFESNFPDALALMGEKHVVKAFLSHPKGSLVQVECSPYNFEGRAIIIGDAAHSMVPFYGQGMNCGFEDVRVLMETLEKCKHDTREAFDQYSVSRHKDLKAILKLALDNYKEMSHDVVSVKYLLRKKIDTLLGKLFPRLWVPLYTLVSFRGDIPYSRAVAIEKRQERVVQKVQYLLLGGALYVALKVYKRFKNDI